MEDEDVHPTIKKWLTSEGDETPADRWVLLELMGHRRLAGKLTEETIGGASFLRIDVPDGATQFYTSAAVYCITPIDEDIARRFAKRNRPQPIQTYELPKPESPDEHDVHPDLDADYDDIPF